MEDQKSPPDREEGWHVHEMSLNAHLLCHCLLLHRAVVALVCPVLQWWKLIILNSNQKWRVSGGDEHSFNAISLPSSLLLLLLLVYC